jgi:ABC-type nitrate/sulfonate/bicarbonate transport system substrate-binding protein
MQRWIVRRSWLVAAIVVGAAALSGCGGGGNESSGGTGGGTSGANAVKSSITVGINNPNYATQLPIFIAKAKGYFDEVGIKNVRVITTDNFVPGLVGGSLDLSQGDTDQWLTAAQKSGKVVYVATYRDKEWHMLGVSKDIKAPQDLVGKKVTAGERGGRNEFVLKTMLSKIGVNPDDVDFVPLGGGSDARLQALINNQVQGAVIFPRHEQPLKDSGGKIIFRDLADVPQEGIATRTDYLQDNRATVVAFLKATLKARQYMQDLSRRDEILKIMRDAKFDIPPEFEALYKTEIDQVSPDGGFDPAQMDELVKEEQDLDIIPADLNWRDLVDLGPLHDAQDALGLDQRPGSLG